MTDPNLDLGLDYTGGINKPTSDQIGYFARVDASGLNLEYVTLAQLAALLGVNLPVIVTNARGALTNARGQILKGY